MLQILNAKLWKLGTIEGILWNTERRKKAFNLELNTQENKLKIGVELCISPHTLHVSLL